MIHINDVSSGEIIEREETAEELVEIKQREIEGATQLELREKDRLEKENAKLALLEKLGITEEEAKLLLS